MPLPAAARAPACGRAGQFAIGPSSNGLARRQPASRIERAVGGTIMTPTSTISTRVGNAGDFHAVVPMMRRHRLRQQEFDPALYALHPDADRRFRLWIGTVIA